MNSLNKILLSFSLALLSTTNIYAATATYGAYAYGSDLIPGYRETEGGLGFSTASVTAPTFNAIATLGGTSYTPILKAIASSTGTSATGLSDDVTQSRAAAFQTYTSSITQTITLDLSLHGITTADSLQSGWSSVSVDVNVLTGNTFIIDSSTAQSCNGIYAFSNYLCGKSSYQQLYINSTEQTLIKTLSFDVLAGEEFIVYANLRASAFNGVADASQTFTSSFADDTYIQAVGVSAVPVPAAAWLFASGLLGLVSIARRKV